MKWKIQILKKIIFNKIASIDILEKLSSLEQIEEIILFDMDVNYIVLENILIVLQKFQNLKKLTIQNYYDTKYLPDEIGNLTKLTHLHINLTKLEELPASITNLSNLISLNVELNELKSLPTSIKDLKNLEEIDISYNEINDIFTELSGMNNLGIKNIARFK